jgi:GNAT superfamily N-acetyltransferase
MTVGDAAVVAELVEELGYSRTVAEVGEWCESVMSRGDQVVFVAEVGGEVVGWVEVSVERRLQSAPFALIGGLVVRDGKRGGGVGRLLCEEAERWAKERGLAKVRVTSRSTREKAHRFYLRDGYEAVKTSVVFEKKTGA